jgi:hypothetical protein
MLGYKNSGSSMVKTHPFDAAKHLDNPEVIFHYLAEAAATDDNKFILGAIQNVVRASMRKGRNMKNLNQIIAKLPPAQRAKIKKRARELIAQEKRRRDVGS